MTQVNSIGPATASNTTARNSNPTQYTVHKGDNLSDIASRHGISLSALQAANPDIAKQRFIFPGDKLTIPGQNSTSHVVSRGETLTSIARQNGTTWQAIASANRISNPDVISIGQRLTIPGQTNQGQSPSGGERVQAGSSSAQPATAGGAQEVQRAEASGLNAGTLRLSPTDVLNLKKTLQTEWVQSAGTGQAHGIIDTILNRQASGHWGNSISSVVNANNQFSDVNGPISRRQHGRSSVEQIPSSMISSRVNDVVDAYLAQRAGGAPSSVGTHLNYANPHFSDARNLPWIMALNGPVLGRGNAIHRHGTTPDLQRYRPDNYAISLTQSGVESGLTAGRARTDTPAPAQRINGAGAPASNGQFVNPTGGEIRNDSGGQGHFGASRHRANGPGRHHGLDILSTAGQPVRAPISGTLTRVNPNNVHSGFQIVSPDGRTAVRVFYAAPNSALIGQRVNVGDVVAAAQDLQMRGQYPANVRDHVHVEMRVGGNQVDPAPYFLR